MGERETGGTQSKEERASKGLGYRETVNGGLNRSLEAAGPGLVGGLGGIPRGRCISHTLASLSPLTFSFLPPFLPSLVPLGRNLGNPTLATGRPLCTGRDHFHVGIFNSARWQITLRLFGHQSRTNGRLCATHAHR